MLVGLALGAETMMGVPVTSPLLTSGLAAGAWLGVGALMGALHFLTLHWTVRRLATGRAPALALVIQMVRLAVLAVVLAIIAHGFGAMALLIATAGVLTARAAVLRWGAPQP